MQQTREREGGGGRERERERGGGVKRREEKKREEKSRDEKKRKERKTAIKSIGSRHQTCQKREILHGTHSNLAGFIIRRGLYFPNLQYSTTLRHSDTRINKPIYSHIQSTVCWQLHLPLSILNDLLITMYGTPPHSMYQVGGT